MKAPEAFYFSPKYKKRSARNRVAPRGYRGSWCKVCKAIYDKMRRAQFPELLAEQATQKYLKHYSDGRHIYWQGIARARKYGAKVISITLAEWRELYNSTACHWCGFELHPSIRQMDHIVPLSEGGEHSARNIVAACANCNCRRSWERKIKHAHAPKET